MYCVGRSGKVKCWTADRKEPEVVLIENAFPKACAHELAQAAIGWTDEV